MKKLSHAILVLPFIIILSCTQKATKPNAIVKSSISEVSDHLKSQVESFVKVTEPNRSVGEVGHKVAIDWIAEKFKILTLNNSNTRFYVHEFHPDIKFAKDQYQKDFNIEISKKFKRNTETYQKWSKFTKESKRFISKYSKVRGQNLIFEIKGKSKPNEVLTIGAHYDTITHDHKKLIFTPKAVAPGADDNASALIILLELAERFTKNQPEKTIRFVAFDFEELFFLGSYALAKDISKNKTNNEINIGLINLEMLGWSKSSKTEKLTYKIYTRTNSDVNYEKDMFLANLLQNQSHPRLNPVILNNGFNRSDNWSFWQFNIPAICVTQDWESDFNENYHTDKDLPENLNYEYMALITENLEKAIKKGLGLL